MLKMVLSYTPHRDDSVVIEASLNDVRRGPAYLGRYVRNLRAMLAHLRRATLHDVVVISDPPIARWAAYAPYNRGSVTVLRAYRDATERIAQSFGARFLDLAPGWHLHVDVGIDGIHPSDAGMRRIGARVQLALSP